MKSEEVEKIENCPHCNNTGKVYDAWLGNYVPCDTENDCKLSQKEK